MWSASCQCPHIGRARTRTPTKLGPVSANFEARCRLGVEMLADFAPELEAVWIDAGPNLGPDSEGLRASSGGGLLRVCLGARLMVLAMWVAHGRPEVWSTRISATASRLKRSGLGIVGAIKPV